MLKEERFEIILKELERGKMVTYETFASLLFVSEDTARRDIDYLYRNGLLSKARGGAMLRKKDPLSFQDRTTLATDAKNIIGLKAQKFIGEGMTVFMDGGTTTRAVASHFPIDLSLRVVTNNTEIIPVLSQFSNIELIILGGVYHKETATTTGVDTCLDAARYIADIYFMGNCAMDCELGSSASFQTDAEIKRTMIKTSKKVIALTDQNKLRRTEPFKVAALEKIDILITNLSSNDKELDDFRNLGLQLL
jgi:DeoR/GlpR family transcriptional regulator of sugar metabolism